MRLQILDDFFKARRSSEEAYEFSSDDNIFAKSSFSSLVHFLFRGIVTVLLFLFLDDLSDDMRLQSWTKVNGTTTKNGIVLVATSN